MPQRSSTSSPTSFVDLLRQRAQEHPDRLAFSFLQDGETETARLSYGELDGRARAIAAHLQERGLRGERALLLYNPGLDFVAGFFGCLYAGVTAVPAYPPRSSQLLSRLASIMQDADTAVALTSAASLEGIVERLRELEGIGPGALLATDTLPEGRAADWHPPSLQGEDLAFLQYTSGSTGQPKGVMVSHGNLLHNSELINLCFQDSPGSLGVSWLPPYHDMGLVGGVLQPLYVGASMLLMPPASFLQRPFRWLEAISRHGATTSGGPDFAYAYCARQVRPEQRDTLDLSSWSLAFTGAEPVRAETLDRFCDAFASCGFRREAFVPCYGMAENTLIITGARKGTSPHRRQFAAASLGGTQVGEITPGTCGDAKELVSSGTVVGEQQLRVVDPERMESLEDGCIGEIWVSGDSVALGYRKQEELTANTFHARLPDDPHRYLRTGDLGFLQEGQLFVTGRRKDLIIIRGRNLYPQDIETTMAQAHTALREGFGAAFSLEEKGEERLVVVQEVERTALRRLDVEAVTAAIRAAVAESHQVVPSAIVLLKTGTIPKTSSGKIQRFACRQGFVEGSLESVGVWQIPSGEEQAGGTDASPPATPTAPSVSPPPAAPSRQERAVQEWFLRYLSETLGLRESQIDVHQPLSQFGLDSMAAVRLTADLEDWLAETFPERPRSPLAPTLAYDYPTIALIAAALFQQAPGDDASDPSGEASPGGRPFRDDDIAVVGMGCRLPGAHGPAALWELLREGGTAVRSAREAGITDRGFGRPPAEQAGFLDAIELFDAAFFGIPPREAEQMDPQQRLLLETTWEAFEHAGIPPERWSGTRGAVFVGISSNDYGQLQGEASVYWGTGNAHSIAANRLSYLLDLRGPSMAVDTACSSSLVAVHQAVRSLQGEECDQAIAAGVNLLLSPELTDTFQQAGMLAPDGRCKTFDATADGYVRAEGCGVVLLKRLADARRDGDRVWGVICGSAVNQDGRSNGLTAPSGLAQQRVVREALRRAGIRGGEVSYVEAHGTGTSLGDPIEVNALCRVLAPGRREDQGCRFGSLKANLGHLEAAAGIGGLIKVLLCLEQGALPPHPHLGQLNPLLELEGTPFAINTTLTPWSGEGRFAGISSFGFGGTNAHLVVTAPPPRTAPPAAPSCPGTDRSDHLFTLSARSPEALAALQRSTAALLSSGIHRSRLADLCHSANVGRSPMPFRATWVGHDPAHLEEALQREALPVHHCSQPPTVAFLFTGQGSQAPGVGGELLATQPVFREVITSCHQILDSLQVLPEGWTLQRILQHSSGSGSTDDGDGGVATMLEQTGITQPVLFSLEVALARQWMGWGIRPDWVMGHSVGEVAAACIAGVFDVEDGLRLISHRSRLMAALPTGGGMLALFTDAATAAALLEEQRSPLVIAAENGPANVVLSGPLEAIAALEEPLLARGIGSKRLRVSHAFHSPLMEPMLADFRQLAAAIRYHEPRIPIVSNISHGPVGSEMASPDYWCRHILAPVLFGRSLQTLRAQGVDAYLEIGPRPTLIEMARAGDPDPRARWLASLRPGRSDTRQMLETLAELHRLGATVDWDAFDAPFPRERIPLPTYPWQRSRHWLPAKASPVGAMPADRFSTRWQSLPLPGTPPAGKAPEGQWLLVGPRALHERFRQALPAGQNCCWVEEHAVFKEFHPRHWQINPDKAEHWRALFRGLGSSGRILGILQVLEAPGEGETLEPWLAHPPPRQPSLVQALLETDWPGEPPRLWWLSSPWETEGIPLSTRLVQGLALGFARCLALEHPELWGGWLESASYDTEDAMAHLAAELSACWSDQPAARPLELQVRWHQGERQVARLVPAPPGEGPDGRKPQPCRLDGPVLISGGLGALGMETAAWLLERGVRSLILVGRKLPSPETQARLDGWRRKGALLTVVQADLNDPACVPLLSDSLTASGLPLRAIFHAAGVLEDASVARLTEAAWERVLRPKGLGAWHLHQLSLLHPVDGFFLYSSLAAVLGSPGQAAYGAANALLDTLARHRRELGLPALSLNWGPWRGGGMAERAHARSGRSLESYGMVPLPASSYLQALEPWFPGASSPELPATAVEGAVLAVARLQRDTLAAVLEGRPQASFLGLATERASAIHRRIPGPPLQAELLALPPQERPERLLRYLQATLAGLLEIEAKEIGEDLHLLEIGADSLLLMDALSQIQKDLGLMLYPRELYSHPRIGALARYLADALQSLQGGTAAATTAPAALELPAALRFRRPSEGRETEAKPPRLPSALFVLSSPRAGSTLLRVMLAGHPQLFSPPELHLLPFATMADRQQALADSHLGEGLERALMELDGFDAGQSRALLRQWVEQALPIQGVYAHLQERAGGRLLVDKSPTYALDLDTLRQAEELFEKPTYIHLVRHPYAVIRSFVDLRMEQLFGGAEGGDPYQLAELVWRECNRNVLQLEEEIGPARIHRIVYEELVTQPGAILRKLCAFLGLPFDPALLAPYEGKRLTDGLHRQSLSVGDPNFSRHRSIDASLADSWQTAKLPAPLQEETTRLAESLGYTLPEPPAATSSLVVSALDPTTEPQRREEVLEVQGLQICRCEWGPIDGPPLLCVHGVLDQGLIWERVALPLAAAGFRVIAPDLRGHGHSDPVGAGGNYQILDFIADAVGLTDQLLTRPMGLIGHSLGTVVASGLAMLRPSLVDQLFLIEPVLPAPSSPDDVRETVQTLVGYALTPPKHRPMASLEVATERLLRAMPSLPQAFAERLTERGTRPEGEGLVWRWDPALQTRTSLHLQGGALDRSSYQQLLANLSCPITVIQGDASTFNRPEDLAALRAALPRARWRMLPGGHNLVVETPEGIGAALLETLQCAPRR